MPLRTGATLTFVGFQTEVSETQPVLGVRLHFVCGDPGPEQPSDYYIILTAAEIAAASNQTQLRTLVQGKLNDQIRFAAYTAKLTPFIGQSLVV
ncbi:MAG TPA: hypothetical protein VJL59_05560 [Anaerolineales bacterium]|nr:hypothetical protein [Anaerolineales bacterium]